ncbi:protein DETOXIFICATION 49-like [Andrographis paniculata]|uniref:protein DETOXIFICATION 49-like n=1 Tax=Andrographis paniculata TaxID=175694 RepID=UPI0021E75C58|nr:protein DETOXIFICATION 49-like [Andrographis paniculata]
MCQQTTTSSSSSNHHQDQKNQDQKNHDQDPNPNVRKSPNSDMYTSLIPKSPTPTRRLRESLSLAATAFPIAATGLLLYSRSAVSMLFLGRLGPLPLAGGSLALAFANISGYSILSGLAAGMDPLCTQAAGAGKFPLLGLSLQRTVLLLLLASLPISLLWLHVSNILTLFGQDSAIAAQAQAFLFFSLPDLIAQSFLHPLRIYLRTQSITLPATFCAAAAMLMHIPINYLLVVKLDLGIKGVAISGVLTNVNVVVLLIGYVIISKVYKKSWEGVSPECFSGWKPLLDLAVPSCAAVCLEWWWYEIMILLCGLLKNPAAAVAAMGILIQTTSLIYIFPSSLSFSVSTRVGNLIGAGRVAAARAAAGVGMAGSFMIGAAALIFAVAVRNIWARMFTGDEEIIGLTAAALPIIGLCELGNCPQTTGCGVLRGTARPKVGANINLGCFYLVGMPVAVGLAFWGGMDFRGLWLGLLAAQAACVATMMAVLRRTDWEAEARRAEELTGGGPGPGVGGCVVTAEYNNNNNNDDDDDRKGDSLC